MADVNGNDDINLAYNNVVRRYNTISRRRHDKLQQLNNMIALKMNVNRLQQRYINRHKTSRFEALLIYRPKNKKIR